MLTYITAYILFCSKLIAGGVAENISEDMKTYLNLKGKGNYKGFVVVLCKNNNVYANKWHMAVTKSKA